MSISVVLRNFAGMKKHLKSYLPLAAGVAVLMLWLVGRQPRHGATH
jgi:hypothetical protein